MSSFLVNKQDKLFITANHRNATKVNQKTTYSTKERNLESF